MSQNKVTVCILDPLSDFYVHNKPLYNEMLKNGYLLVYKNGYQHFVDEEDNYIEHPVWYITGPFFKNSNVNPYPYYISIKREDGWWQRSFKTKFECVEWARSIIKEHYNAGPS